MKKLSQLKEWLTLDDCAKYLTMTLQEEVAVADVLRLALDGHLILSVDFVNHASANLGKKIDASEVNFNRYQAFEAFFSQQDNHELKGKEILLPDATHFPDGRYVRFEKEVVSVEGVWDLTMVGSERLDVEHKYQRLIDGPSVTLIGMEGAFVSNSDGNFARILESFDENEFIDGSLANIDKLEQDMTDGKFSDEKAKALRKATKFAREKRRDERVGYRDPNNYYPAAGLPSDCNFVVRMKAIRAFIAMIESPKPEKPFGLKQKQSIALIINALCREAGIDVAQTSKAAKYIEGLTIACGAKVGDSTIETYLREIQGATAARGR
jgi:hypothetical protein